MNKPFQRHIYSTHSILEKLFLILLEGFRSLYSVTKSSMLVAVGILHMPLHFIIFVIIIIIIIFIIFISVRIFIKSGLLFL